MNRTGKVVLITGASSGIGEGAARLLAAQGHRLVIGARRTDRLVELTQSLEETGGIVRYRKLDVTSADDMAAFARFALDAFGRIRAIAYAMKQPADVDVSEIVVRPTASPF